MNGAGTFPLWDDFNEASINTTVLTHTGSPIISNGVIELPFGSVISSTNTYAVNHSAVSLAKLGHPSSYYGTFGFYNSGSYTHGAVIAGGAGETTFYALQKAGGIQISLRCH